MFCWCKNSTPIHPPKCSLFFTDENVLTILYLKCRSMKKIYVATTILTIFLFIAFTGRSQTPTQVTGGICTGVVANFNTSDEGFNSPSVYGSIFDSAMYYNGGRGYWTDYMPPLRIGPPGAPRVMNIISPPYANPNPTGTFNVGFHYIVPNPATDRFQIRIISVTQTPLGTVTNVEASSGVQFFAAWPPPGTPYVDGVTTPVPDPTPFLVGTEGNVCVRLIDADIVNGPNTNFRVEVTYLINEPLFAVFDNLSIGPLNIPLPVDFIGLVAEKNSNNVNLKWDVTEEVNVREYQVERSTTGTSFTSVGTAAAKGKSIYYFTDIDVPNSALYYRIKSVDIDGKFKYSGILKVSGNNSFSNTLKLYPMPATNGEVTAQHRRLRNDAKLTITTTDGRIVKTIIPVPGASHTPIDISTLSSGLYIVRLDDGTGDIQSAKLIKP